VRPPGLSGIDDAMLRRLRVLFVFVGAVWLGFGVVRAVSAAMLGAPALIAAALLVGSGFLAAAVLAHLELRRRSG
jgi:ABC-type thiamin/hydroxymethylpyrimidine transport system permease subunit